MESASSSFSPDHSEKEAVTPHRILVIKLGALGDFIQALGPMAAIRRSHPMAQITLLTTAPFKELALQCGYFDRVILDKRPRFYNVMGWMTLCNTLNEGRYDRVYDLQNNDRTSFYFQIMSPQPEWVGVAKRASHRNTSPERTKGHAFEGHKQTLALAGIEDVQIDELHWMSTDLSRFALKAPYILFVPGCAPTRPEKRWPAKNYAELANIMTAMGYQPVILGTQDEAQVTAEIVSACPAALNLTGKTSLPDIATLARGAAAAVGNDTGPMHLIAATGCPCLTLFSGHSNTAKHAPMGKNSQVLQARRLVDLSLQEVLDHIKPRGGEKPKSKTRVH